jgi:hypothetical protein
VRDYIGKFKGKPTANNQKARKNTDDGIAQQEGQAPKHTKGKQPRQKCIGERNDPS